MKVLIIEDNDYKLDNAVQTLKEFGIEEYIHINNFDEASYMCFRKKLIDELDFIILDIQFYSHRLLAGSRELPDTQAGYKFLKLLACGEKTVPVFVFSSVADYEAEYREFLFPPFSEYQKQFKSYNFNFSAFSFSPSISEVYTKQLAVNEQIFQQTTFVVGQAHDKYELESLIKNHLDSNNQ